MRLIDADALIEKSLKDANCYMDNNDIKHGYHNVQCLIYDAPTIDAVPVVRCKNCFLYGECQAAKFYGDDGYCSCGERRKDE